MAGPTRMRGATRADDSQALVHAAHRGHDSCLSYLLKCGADPNAKGGDALRLAAALGHTEYLLDPVAAGADPRSQCSGALYDAVVHEKPDCAAVLFAAGDSADKAYIGSDHE